MLLAMKDWADAWLISSYGGWVQWKWTRRILSAAQTEEASSKREAEKNEDPAHTYLLDKQSNISYTVYQARERLSI